MSVSVPGLLQLLEDLQPFVYGGLAVVAFLQWRRHPGPASAWLAAAFGALGVAIVAGQLLPEGSTGAAVVWARKGMVAVLVLFPYLLYRFMTSLIAPVAWIRIAAPTVTGAVALGALVLPPFPETSTRPAWFQVYVAVLLTQWVSLSGIVSFRIWRARRGQPTVVRRRMLTMSVGAAGLSLALVIAGELSGAGAADVIVRLLVLTAAPLMLVGFAPPYVLRVMWRKREEAAMNETALSLMEATSAGDVARTLLPQARMLVGAAVALLEDTNGEILGTEGLEAEDAHAAIEALRAGRAVSDGSQNGSVLAVPMRSGRLTVVASTFAAFFGRDEVASLNAVAALADLALARIHLIENQRRLAEIVESSAEAIIAKSLDGTIVGWNRGAEQIYGYDSKEALGKPITIIVPPGLEDEAAAMIRSVRNEKSVENRETKRRTKDGRIIDVSLTVSPIKDADGRVIGASAICRDITELKRAAAAVRESEARYRTIINTAKDAYIEIDTGSVVREWNEAAAEMFQIPRVDALGRRMPELIMPARYRDAHVAGVSKYLATGEAAVLNTTVEVSALREGSEFPVELTIWPVGQAPEISFHAFVRDVTERNAAEGAIKAAHEEADRANRAKSEFLSRMSHELRTPMNAVLGFAQLLDMDPLTPEQNEATGEIIKAGKHLLELIDEVLDISRIEAGGLRLSLEPVDAIQLVEESVSLMRPAAGHEGVSVNVERYDVFESPPFVIADRQRLKQVLVNLISNGIKYNRQHGSIHIYLERTQGRLRICVKDTGHGIPHGRMQQLFEPFQRLGAEASGIEGTGLGLALSKRLVEAMGGTISVTSELGQGSTFSVELASAEGVQRFEVNESSLGELAAVPASPIFRTILYIEDNLSNMKVVERFVARRPGITLIPAMQGGIGVTLARDHRPDLIFLDLNLPDIPGEEVLARLQSDPRTAALPVVVISADVTAGQIQRLLDAGARAYLTKPLELNHFLQVIDEFCAVP